MDKQQEFVLRTLEERDIRFVRLWFTDVLGFLKSVAVAPAELEGAFDEGIGFDGSAIEGFARVYESDMIAKPDPGTFQILPWRAESPGTARMFCDILMPDGSPSFADPRFVLKRILARTSDLGFTFYTHPEIEFFLLNQKPVDGTRPVPADSSGYFDHTPQNIGMDFRRQAITMLESMGISVEFSHHEGAPGQQEIDLRYADALSTADNVMTFRLVMKQVALELGVQATFMPKPFSEFPGSGMHTHLSLFEGDRNAFYESGSEFQLSKVGRSFIAGLLRHAGEISAVTNQWVNSYKRIWGGSQRTAGAGGEAPSYICWGHNNRSALVRVPLYKPGKTGSTRVEVRSLDSGANPYLAYAVLLAAGLKGIEGGYELPAGADDDVWALSDAERRSLGIEPLPQNLGEAITLMERSELVAETLGEHVFDFFLRNKKQEWEEYRSEVTPFELRKNLPVL
ncbi:glutamine synthetase family protein [Streptomyces sp. NPDC005336]|uniref:glutamine synthetase family protein n=1 Tax=unclassified Streptomyces TaxID=2593676 RepID=UPI0033ADD922